MAETNITQTTQEGLYYSEAYSLLFNSISDIVERQAAVLKDMLILQKHAEEICTTGLPVSHITVEQISEQISGMLADLINKNMQ